MEGKSGLRQKKGLAIMVRPVFFNVKVHLDPSLRREYLTFMSLNVDFSRLTEIITENVDAKQIILFGSYAQNMAGPDSDIDILILVDDSASKIQEIAQLLHRKIHSVIELPCDILVEHENTFRERSALPTIERAIAREGKILYAA